MQRQGIRRVFAAVASMLIASNSLATALVVETDTVVATPKLLGAAQKLLPAGAPPSASAGGAVALGEEIALVGAPNEAGGGAVYVYLRGANGSYALTQRLISPMAPGGRFGAAIALQSDIVAIGAPTQTQPDVCFNCGSVWVGTVSGGEVTLTQQLVAQAPRQSGDQFGAAVAIDGNSIAVGSPFAVAGGTTSGEVHVFVKTGSFFLQQAVLTIDFDASGFSPVSGQAYGGAVAIRGNRLYVGAPQWSGNIGLVIRYVRSGSIWTHDGNNDGGIDTERFGSAIAVSPDGRSVYIGGPTASSNLGIVRAYDASTGGMFFAGDLQHPPNVGARFGSSLAADDANLIVGSPNFTGTFAGQGAFHHYAGNAVDGLRLKQRTVASDPDAFDGYGTSVAYFGGAVLAGVPALDDVQADAGGAYVYDAAVEEAILVDPNGGPLDVFGTSLAIAGNIKMVGVPHGSGGFGEVEIYQRVIDAWTQGNNAIRLSGGPEQFECGFGAAIAMSDDTTIVVVGAPRYDVGALADRGRAFVFERSGDAWTPAGVLDPPDGAANDLFGASVTLSPDGNTIVVGAPNFGPTDDGKIYVFKRPAPGPLAAAKGAGFTAAASRAGGIGDKFGSAVSVDNGGAIAVGAPLRTGGRGAVEIMRETGPGTYAIEPLVDPSAAAGDNFGAAVSLRDGELVVGIPNADSPALTANNDAGAAMMFDAGTTSSVARGTRMIPADARIGDKFGSSVGVSGGVAIVGAPLRDPFTPAGLPRTDAGTARLLLRVGTDWNIDAEIVATDNANGDQFGSAVAIRDRTLTSGAPLNDNEGEFGTFADQGASYVFRIGPRDPALFESGFE
ncbi:MAG TPA: hypothetical protein VND91_10970 [Candidatus Saccharimonadia bacterium]|nr:hypothetical protein [Candidatus Saccharimonadia bacterium]